MADRMTAEEMNKVLFANMVMMLASSTMQQLGKTIDPMTGKTKVDLEGAQATLDMLLMLEAKTKGNLDKDEQRLMRETLTSLQLNYVETAQSQPPAKEPAAGTGRSEPAANTATSSAAEAAAEAEKGKKFHKSYGEA